MANKYFKVVDWYENERFSITGNGVTPINNDGQIISGTGNPTIYYSTAPAGSIISELMAAQGRRFI